MTWFALVVNLLACHRLVRLVTKDVIAHRPRNAVIRWAYSRAGHDDEILLGDLEPMVEADMAEDPGGTPKLAVLVVCRWCASIHVAAGVTLAQWAVPELWRWPALLLALSSGSTFLARVEAE